MHLFHLHISIVQLISTRLPLYYYFYCSPLPVVLFLLSRTCLCFGLTLLFTVCSPSLLLSFYHSMPPSILVANRHSGSAPPPPVPFQSFCIVSWFSHCCQTKRCSQWNNAAGRRPWHRSNGASGPPATPDLAAGARPWWQGKKQPLCYWCVCVCVSVCVFWQQSPLPTLI